MATWKVRGMDEYIAQLERLSDDSTEYIREAIKAGAGEVADAVRSGIQSLPVGPGWGRGEEKISTITSVQKAGLLAGFGIAPMREDGSFLNVKLGFNGYNGQMTHKYRGGQPNSVIARSICSGTSFRQKNDFVGRAVSATKNRCEETIKKKIEESIKKLTGG